jgi:FkbM family methyltransferase
MALAPAGWLRTARALYQGEAAGWRRSALALAVRAASLNGIPDAEPFPVPGGAPLRMVPADSYVANRVYWLGLDGYEPGGARWWGALTATHTSTVELGANIGLYTLLGASAAPGRPYVAVEPNPVTCSILRHNIELNRLGNVEVREAAVAGARTATTAQLRVPYRDRYGIPAGAFIDGAADLAPVAGRAVRIPLVAAADVLAGTVDLVKLDIEGLELEVLSAVRPWLVATAPTLVVEVRDEASRLQAFIAALAAEVGYRCLVVDAAGLAPLPAESLTSGRRIAATGIRDVTLLHPGRHTAAREAADDVGLAWQSCHEPWHG